MCLKYFKFLVILIFFIIGGIYSLRYIDFGNKAVQSANSNYVFFEPFSINDNNLFKFKIKKRGVYSLNLILIINTGDSFDNLKYFFKIKEDDYFIYLEKNLFLNLSIEIKNMENGNIFYKKENNNFIANGRFRKNSFQGSNRKEAAKTILDDFVFDPGNYEISFKNLNEVNQSTLDYRIYLLKLDWLSPLND